MEKWKEGVCEHIQAMLDILHQQEVLGVMINSDDSIEVQCKEHKMYVELWSVYYQEG